MTMPTAIGSDISTFPMPADLTQLTSDYPSMPDEGDGGTTVLQKPSLNSMQRTAASAQPKPTRPPFPHTLKRGSTGRDVIAVQRTMMKAGIRDGKKHPPTGDFGWRTEWEVRTFQFHQGMKPTGVVDHPTWRRMNYSKPSGASLFDAYGYWLATHPFAKLAAAPTNEREAIVRACMFAYYRAAATHYVQERPMLDFKVRLPNWDQYCDCSEFATWAYWYGTKGTVDPTGEGFSGYGNTDTMLETGKECASTPKPGDLILYANPGHVTVVAEWPMVVSQGSEAAPFYLPYNYRPPQAFRTYLPA